MKKRIIQYLLDRPVLVVFLGWIFANGVFLAFAGILFFSANSSLLK
jgi:hypothetical protein